MVDIKEINFNEKKIIIADVDETICETTQLVTAEMAGMIDSLILRGFVFAFISGTKEKYLTEMLSNQLKQKHYLLPCTGMQCIEVSGRISNEEELKKTVVYNNKLGLEERTEIMEALEKLCKMAKLLGVMPFLVGIKPNAALALIELGYTDSGLRMALDTEQAIFLIEEALVSEDQLDEDEENELSDGSESDEVISDEEKEPAQDD